MVGQFNRQFSLAFLGFVIFFCSASLANEVRVKAQLTVRGNVISGEVYVARAYPLGPRKIYFRDEKGRNVKLGAVEGVPLHVVANGKALWQQGTLPVHIKQIRLTYSEAGRIIVYPGMSLGHVSLVTATTHLSGVTIEHDAYVDGSWKRANSELAEDEVSQLGDYDRFARNISMIEYHSESERHALHTLGVVYQGSVAAVFSADLEDLRSGAVKSIGVYGVSDLHVTLTPSFSANSLPASLRTKLKKLGRVEFTGAIPKSDLDILQSVQTDLLRQIKNEMTRLSQARLAACWAHLIHQ